jgi:DNA topoisomerase-1
VPLLEQFWRPFKDRIEHTEENVKRSDVTQEALDETCPKCGAPLSIRLGKHGRFIGCTRYPECDYTRDLREGNAQKQPAPEIVEGRACPECGAPLQVKRGKYGKFIGCTGYPKCRYIEPLDRPQDTGVTCPKCGKGTMLKKKSRRGKVFYSCSTYPKCDYAVWNEPVKGPCPRCGWPILTVKVTRSKGAEKVCPQKSCSFSEPLETGSDADTGAREEDAAAS